MSLARAAAPCGGYLDGVASYSDHDANRRMMDLITGRNSALKMMDDNRKMVDLITGRNSPLKMMDDSRRLLDLILASPARASALGAQRSISEMIAVPSFASMVGTSAFPRPAWTGVLDDLRDFIPDDLHADTEAEFAAAGAEVEGVGDGDTWWIARLSTEWQLRLLLSVLVVLYLTADFYGKAAGAELPPELVAGMEALGALAATILLFMEAKARVMKGEDPP